jgi:hypothetical protein
MDRWTPPQIRTCGFPASGSSKTWVRYAPATAVAHPEVQQPGSRLACSAIRPSLVDMPNGSLAPGIFPSSESTSPVPPLPQPAPSGRLPGFAGTTEALYHSTSPRRLRCLVAELLTVSSSWGFTGSWGTPFPICRTLRPRPSPCVLSITDTWVLLSRLGFPPGVRPLRQPQR